MATLKLKQPAAPVGLADLAAAPVPAADTKPVIMHGATSAKIRRMVFTKAVTIAADFSAVTGGRDPWGSARTRYVGTFDAIKSMASPDRTIDKIARSQTTRGPFTGTGCTDIAILYANGIVSINWDTGAIKPARRGFPSTRPSGHVNGSYVTADDLAWRAANPD